MVTSWVLAGVCTPRPLAPVRSRQPTPRPPEVQAFLGFSSKVFQASQRGLGHRRRRSLSSTGPRRNRRQAAGAHRPKTTRYRQLSAAEIQKFPGGHGNGFRKRSEYCEMDDFAAFVGFRFISAAFGGWKSRESKGPWKWLPDKERTLQNGRFCCFCGVPSFRQLSAAGNPTNHRGPWKWLPEKERTLRNGRFCCFCGAPFVSARFCLFCGVPSFRQLSAAIQRARRGQEEAEQKEARKRPEEARKRPEEAQVRPGRGQPRGPKTHPMGLPA